ncbi:hypothetical protein ACFW4K_02860 [Nocardiopsis alba]|uniref:hypothetical protein n=1 Tax=Nocardiopsis alba TaxID=53437 RepID=UPI00366B056C
MRDEQGGAWWIASGWAKENAAGAGKILARLADEQLRTARVFEEGEEPSAFMAWLYATRPAGLATLGTPTGFGIGAADAGGVFAFQVTGPDAFMSGTTAEDTARQWVNAWRNAGRPG